MQLRAAVVVFAAPLPHAVVRYPVGPFHTVHQVLDEGHLHTQGGGVERTHTSVPHKLTTPDTVVLGTNSHSHSHSLTQELLDSAPGGSHVH